MELKHGYQQTEVGVIPEDWILEPLEACLSYISYGFTNPMPTTNNGVPMVTARDIAGGKIQFSTVRYTSEIAYRTLLTDKSRPRSGDLLLTKDGTLGRLAVVGDEPICINQSVAVLRPNGKCDTRFLKILLEAPVYQDRMLEDAGGSTIKHIYITIVDKMPVGIPPTLAEQEAIAEALSDADALIDSLEQLIAKKRLLKQGAMQDLLTGNKRLPGFEGEWEEATFSSKLRHHSGDSSLIKGRQSSTPIGGYFPGFSASGQDVWLPSYTQEGEALVVSAVGSRCGKCFRASGKWSAIANTHIVWPNSGAVCIDYLMLYIHDEDFWTKGGSGQPFVKFKESFEKVIPWPSIPEQTAIAAILSDMDAEIAALEAKLAKARQVKQGMMQELLTGKTRLV